MIRAFAPWLLAALVAGLPAATPASAAEPVYNEIIDMVLEVAEPLEHPRGDRMPLYMYAACNPGVLTDAESLELVTKLDERGIGLFCSWTLDVEATLAQALPVARAQQKAGLRVSVDTTVPMYRFSDATTDTAHLDMEGNPFFDTSCVNIPLGCPFRLEHRIAPMRERLTRLADAYLDEGLTIDFIYADWEIDAPYEWNTHYESAKRCRVCRERVPDIDANFLAFQQAVRTERSRIEREVLAMPMRERFPGVRVGNYAVYPNDGWRYWYDYFEYYVEGQPALVDQRARYRHWANVFEATRYTMAMPVIYQWSPMYDWYDFGDSDYAWFYNALMVGSNAGRHTPHDIPVVSFVHYHTVDLRSLRGEEDRPMPPQLSAEKYQELLWHLLLRGVDTFFVWSGANQAREDVELAHPVYAAAQQYGEFLDHGVPVFFDVPATPGTVVSGLRLGDRVLVRRTDFGDHAHPVYLELAGGAGRVKVPRSPGRCQVLKIEKHE